MTATLRPCPSCGHVPTRVNSGDALDLIDCPECPSLWVDWDDPPTAGEGGEA